MLLREVVLEILLKGKTKFPLASLQNNSLHFTAHVEGLQTQTASSFSYEEVHAFWLANELGRKADTISFEMCL